MLFARAVCYITRSSVWTGVWIVWLWLVPSSSPSLSVTPCLLTSLFGLNHGGDVTVATWFIYIHIQWFIASNILEMRRWWGTIIQSILLWPVLLGIPVQEMTMPITCKLNNNMSITRRRSPKGKNYGWFVFSNFLKLKKIEYIIFSFLAPTPKYGHFLTNVIWTSLDQIMAISWPGSKKWTKIKVLYYLHNIKGNILLLTLNWLSDIIF